MLRGYGWTWAPSKLYTSWNIIHLINSKRNSVSSLDSLLCSYELPTAVIAKALLPAYFNSFLLSSFRTREMCGSTNM